MFQTRAQTSAAAQAERFTLAMAELLACEVPATVNP